MPAQVRNIIFCILLLAFSANCIAQTNAWGLYSSGGGSKRLELLPRGAYHYWSHGPCGMSPGYREAGEFKISADTVILTPYISSLEQKKFLIARDSVLQLGLIYLFKGQLVEIHRGTIVPNGFGFQVNEKEFIELPVYTSRLFYHDSGVLKEKKESLEGGYTLCTKYYPTGQPEVIESYRTRKKHGYWYYYKPDGDIAKIERYRRNRLLWTKTQY